MIFSQFVSTNFSRYVITQLTNVFLSKKDFAGVFAVASLMVGAVRLRLVPDPNVVFEVINDTSVEIVKPVAGPIDFGYEVSPIMLTSTLTMTVGLFQVSNQWTKENKNALIK